MPGPVRGVIFDIDGTLIDSNDAHARAWCDALAEFGITVPFEKARPLIGMGGDKVSPRALGNRGGHRPRSEDRRAAKQDIHVDVLPEGRSLPEVARAPRATSGRRARARRGELGQGGRARRVSRPRGRQRPDRACNVVERCRGVEAGPRHRPGSPRRPRTRADDVVMVGDTPYDVEASVALRGSDNRRALWRLERRGFGRRARPLRRPGGHARAVRRTPPRSASLGAARCRDSDPARDALSERLQVLDEVALLLRRSGRGRRTRRSDRPRRASVAKRPSW